MDGKIDIDSLITHMMPVERINDAFDRPRGVELPADRDAWDFWQGAGFGVREEHLRRHRAQL
jgi:hypothetical protein